MENNNILKKGFFGFYIILIAMFVISSFSPCQAQARKTLNQDELDAIETLVDLKYFGLEIDGWAINPDVWRMYNFSERKNITETFSVYFKNYTTRGRQSSGFCNFYNMATKKKIARWYNNEYKEFE